MSILFCGILCFAPRWYPFPAVFSPFASGGCLSANSTFLTQKGLLKVTPRIPQKNTPSPSRIHCHRNIPERSHFHAQDLSQSQHPGI